jgi:hypothetical protein
MLKGSPYWERRRELKKAAEELKRQNKFKQLEATVKGAKQ